MIKIPPGAGALMSDAERACILAVVAQMHGHADRLRETAAELRAGTINRHHAANRIEKIANTIAKEK